MANIPTTPPLHADAGFNRLFLGRSEEGFAGVEAAFRLSPAIPMCGFGNSICHLHAYLAQWEQAIEWCNKAARAGGPQFFITYILLAAANVWAGHEQEAKEAAAQLQKVFPGFTVQTWLGIYWSDDPTFNAQYQRIIEGLRKAGVPRGSEEGMSRTPTPRC